MFSSPPRTHRPWKGLEWDLFQFPLEVSRWLLIAATDKPAGVQLGKDPRGPTEARDTGC